MMRLTVAVLLAGAWCAGAAADELTVTLAGERLGEQIPYYTVRIGETEIGTAGAEKALPSVAGSPHIFALADRAAYTQMATFDIPDGLLDSASPVTITLTNAGYDGTSKTGTFLQILGLTVNGQSARLDQAMTPDGGEAFFLSGQSVVINTSMPVAFLSPARGWPVIGSAPVATPAVAPAAATPDPDCSVETALAVTGFSNANNRLAAAAIEQLDGLAATLAGQACRIEVVGYSSLAGPTASNQVLSDERARSVLDYLAGRGVDISAAAARGAGETDQFGVPAENRRVVLTLSP